MSISDSTTLTYLGQANKWNTAADAAGIVSDIEKFVNLKTLILENNTLGPEAALAIGNALSKHPEFEHAIFKDLFTGRLKTEIPQALKHLFSGIVKAGAQIKELDLSDNALGPVGVEGMVDFMPTAACYKLEILRLNNNGLGITGGTMLAQSLGKLLVNSRLQKQPWKLKTFIAGRNRLEKVGAKIFASLFEQLESLEEVAMPQNGIFHEGIAALAKAFSNNPNLKIINLNDNTFTLKGSKAMASELPNMQNLQVINFGDCLLKTEGSIVIARALMEGHKKLEELHLDGNEMSSVGGMSVAEAVSNKPNLRVLNLDCNAFGDNGKTNIEQILEETGKISSLLPMENNEDSDTESGSDGEKESDSESSDSSSDSDDSDVEVISNDGEVQATPTSPNTTWDDVTAAEDLIELPVVPVQCTAAEYAANPSPGRLLGLAGFDGEAGFGGVAGCAIDGCSHPSQRVQRLVEVCVKTAAFTNTKDKMLKEFALNCLSEVATVLFSTAIEHRLVGYTANSLLMHLGLIKSEDKKFVCAGNGLGILRMLLMCAQEELIPKDAANTLHFFISRPSSQLDRFATEKLQLLEALAK